MMTREELIEQNQILMEQNARLRSRLHYVENVVPAFALYPSMRDGEHSKRAAIVVTFGAYTEPVSQCKVFIARLSDGKNEWADETSIHPFDWDKYDDEAVQGMKRWTLERAFYHWARDNVEKL